MFANIRAYLKDDKRTVSTEYQSIYSLLGKEVEFIVVGSEVVSSTVGILSSINQEPNDPAPNRVILKIGNWDIDYYTGRDFNALREFNAYDKPFTELY